MKVMDVAYGWSTSDHKLMSRMIRYFTRPEKWNFRSRAEWSHMFLVFRMENGDYVIHEALGSRGWCETPAIEFCRWLNRDKVHHRSSIHWLGLTSEEAENCYLVSKSFLGMVSYAWKQIFFFALANSLLGRSVGLVHWLRSRPGVICSEMASRIVALNAPRWDLRDNPQQTFDYLSPQNAWVNYQKKEKENAAANK